MYYENTGVYTWFIYITGGHQIIIRTSEPTHDEPKDHVSRVYLPIFGFDRYSCVPRQPTPARNAYTRIYII